MIRLEGQDRDECLRLRNKYYDRRVATGIKWHDEDLQEALAYRSELFKKYGVVEGSTLDMNCAIIFPLGESKVHEHLHG